MLKVALEYAARGFAVFPLVENGKRPATGCGCKDATRDSAQIRRWWRARPNANIGIATGALSGLVVVDIDSQRTPRALRDLIGKTRTLSSRTQSGGTHLLFRHPGREIRNRTGLLPNVDLRGDGGYIVAPPSVVNGRSYSWRTPQSVLQPLPTDLLLLIEATQSERKTTTRCRTQRRTIAAGYEVTYDQPCCISDGEIHRALVRGLNRALESAAIGEEARAVAIVKSTFLLSNGLDFRSVLEKLSADA